MLLLLLGGLLLGAPDALMVLQPPKAPGVLRDGVWPAFDAQRIGRWRLQRSALTRVDAPIPDAAGAIWADREAGGRVRLHRVLFAERTHLVDPVMLPANAPAQAVTEAVRLRLRFLLEAPASQGDPWQAEAAAPPLPPPFELPAEHRGDLELVRAPPIPRRQARIPAPPPPLSVAPPTSDVRAPDKARATWIGLGFDGTADLEGGDGGLLAQVEIPVGATAHIAVHGALHPFHDFERGGRPVGVTGYRAAIAWGWSVWPGRSRLDLRAGLGVRGFSASGADTAADGVQPVGVLDVPFRFEMRPPFAIGLDGGLVIAPGETRAWHTSGTLVRRGFIQARVGLLIEWGVP